jgi:hypothetical protein
VSSPAKLTVAILFIGFGAGFCLWAADHVIAEARTLDKTAQLAGFSDSSDMSAANKAGFTDPITWKADKAARTAAAARAKANAEAQAATEQARKDESNRQFQVAVKAAIALREMMKNPDSFSLERVNQMADGTLCYTYRAANSFNAIIPGQAVFTQKETALSGSLNFPLLWSKHCRGYGPEVENVAYALTYYPRRK